MSFNECIELNSKTPAVPDVSNLVDIKTDIMSASGYTATDNGFIVYAISGTKNSSIRFDIWYGNYRLILGQYGPSSITGNERSAVYDFKPINKGQAVRIDDNYVFDLSISLFYFAPIK